MQIKDRKKRAEDLALNNRAECSFEDAGAEIKGEKGEKGKEARRERAVALGADIFLFWRASAI
jgi:hypothetical protein